MDSTRQDLGWESLPVICQGGLILNMDALTQGTKFPGSATILQNFEPSLSGGYRRISGFTKFDSAIVPGTGTNPVLGLKVALGGVFATRKLVNNNAIYFSSGSGWGSILNGTARNGTVTKARFITYSITEPVVVQTDGVNPAWKYNGTTETLLNGAGAPTNPKYAAEWLNRLVLAGYGDGSKITISSPNDDTDYNAANGAIEMNVGDVVVGIKKFRENLYIFCKRGVKVLSGTTSADFIIDHVAGSIGCLGQDTIQEIGGDLVYLATDSLRSLAATAKIGDTVLASVSQSIQPLITDILDEGLDEYQYFALCIRHKAQYRLFLNNPNSVEADTIGILGKLQDNPVIPNGQFEWATLRGIKPYCADSDFTAESVNDELAVIGHPTNGYVYQLESGNTFDGTAISAVFRTPDMTFDDATLRKVFQKITLFTQLEGDFTSSLNLILDRGDSNIIQPSGISLSETGSVTVYGVGIYDTSTYSLFYLPIFKKNLIGSGFFGGFVIVSNSTSPSFRIDSFQVQFTRKSRR